MNEKKPRTNFEFNLDLCNYPGTKKRATSNGYPGTHLSKSSLTMFAYLKKLKL